MLTFYFKIQKLTPPLHEYSQLEEMLALRALGHSYTVLSDKYGVPKTTIRYLCRKFGLNHEVPTVVIRQRTTTVPETTTYTEKINEGKTYAEYLQAERERKWLRLTKSHS